MSHTRINHLLIKGFSTKLRGLGIEAQFPLPVAIIDVDLIAPNTTPTQELHQQGQIKFTVQAPEVSDCRKVPVS
jgi:hypothetical protein